MASTAVAVMKSSASGGCPVGNLDYLGRASCGCYVLWCSGSDDYRNRAAAHAFGVAGVHVSQPVPTDPGSAP